MLGLLGSCGRAEWQECRGQSSWSCQLQTGFHPNLCNFSSLRCRKLQNLFCLSRCSLCFLMTKTRQNQLPNMASSSNISVGSVRQQDSLTLGSVAFLIRVHRTRNGCHAAAEVQPSNGSPIQSTKWMNCGDGEGQECLHLLLGRAVSSSRLLWLFCPSAVYWNGTLCEKFRSGCLIPEKRFFIL